MTDFLYLEIILNDFLGGYVVMVVPWIPSLLPSCLPRHAVGTHHVSGQLCDRFWGSVTPALEEIQYLVGDLDRCLRDSVRTSKTGM